MAKSYMIRYDTRCYFNVRSKADISQLNLPHGHGSLLQFLFDHGHFWNIDISLCSVATWLRCGGIFKYDLLQIYY